MKNSDEELQRKLEQGIIPNDGMDSQAYQKVFDALTREPDFSLPASFADHILNLVESKEKAREATRDTLWFGLGLTSFLMATFAAFYLTDFKLSTGAFRFVSGYAGLITFGLLFVLLLHWVDRKIVHRNLSMKP